MNEEYDVMYRTKDKARKYEIPYEPNYAENESLKQIKQLLTKGSYTNKTKIHEHIHYLIGLENKFTKILTAEQREEIINDLLPDVLKNVKTMLNKLKHLMRTFE